MATPSIWFQPFTRQHARLVDIITALGDAGIPLAALHLGDTPAGPGILFLDNFTPLDGLGPLFESLPPAGEVHLMAISLNSLPTAYTWYLLKRGVTEVFSWYEVENPVQIVASRLKYWRDRTNKVATLQKNLVGTSRQWLSTLNHVVDVALSKGPVLILGESGTGKELVAQQIHAFDPRPDKRDCIVVDCTNLVPGLSGSELFGHEKGAFTNAISTRDGAIALAHEGTLFLDELGELPLPLQAELLRVLQEGTYKRVGSNVWRKARFRLVSATNRDLAEEVKKGNFRQDLYYRISGWTCRLPPLRERKEDIPVLAEHFFRRLHNVRQPIDYKVFDFLQLKDFPGNVRELQQLVSRIANKHLGEGPITLGDIPQADWPDLDQLPAALGSQELELAVVGMLYQGMGLKEIKEVVTEVAKKVAIHHEKGNLRLAAQRLGCSERILQMHRKNGEPGTENADQRMA
jgi:transcriptional regulator with GAF, ATPase, and Fis domain